jgi:predicted dehydrogenase
MKTALIGLGRMGRRHLQVLRDLGADIVGVCDQSADAVSAAIKEAGLPGSAGFADVRDMLTRATPECVVVATTATTHCAFTCMAAELGARFILCEKPMGVSLDECDRMIAACARHGTRLAVNHQMRFMEQYLLPKKIVTGDDFGGISSVSVIAGNFGLAMNGTHYFEMFRFMTDESPMEVSAWFSPGDLPNPRGPQFHDKAGCVRVVTANGKRFYLDASGDQGHGMLAVYAGPHGRMDVDELAGTVRWFVRAPEHRAQPTSRYGMPWIENGARIPPADAVAPTKSVMMALIEGGDIPTGHDGRTAVATLVAAYVSDENGHGSVAVNAKLPKDRVFPWA